MTYGAYCSWKPIGKEHWQSRKAVEADKGAVPNPSNTIQKSHFFLALLSFVHIEPRYSVEL